MGFDDGGAQAAGIFSFESFDKSVVVVDGAAIVPRRVLDKKARPSIATKYRFIINFINCIELGDKFLL